MKASLALIAVILLAGCVQQPVQETTTIVSVLSPEDGATLSESQVEVRLNLQGLGENTLSVSVNGETQTGTRNSYTFQDLSLGEHDLIVEVKNPEGKVITRKALTFTVKESSTQEPITNGPQPTLTIIEPETTPTIKESESVTVRLSVENFTLVEPGTSPASDGEGYVSIWLDHETELEAGSSLEYSLSELSEGEHVITVQLRKANGNALETPVQEEFTVIVESDTSTETVQEYSIESDDDAFYPSNGDFTVSQGAKIRINFTISTENVYFGGMTIRSPYWEDLTLDPGETGSVEFTASESFEYKSYWPQTNQLKAIATITVE